MDKNFKYNVGIIGTGRIGREIANKIVKKCKKMYVWNRDENKAKGLRADLMKDNVEVASLEDIAEKADIVIITGGIHTPKRAEAFEENSKLMEFYNEIIKNKNKLKINVVNPVDECTYVYYSKSQRKKEGVIGFNHLDCSRLNFLIKDLVKNLTSSKKIYIESYVVGTHNEFMVPVFSRTNITIDGEKINFYDKRLGLIEYKENIINALKNYGPEQVKKIGSSTRIGTAQAMVEVIDAINNQKDYVCMSYLFDLFPRETFLGWPVKFKGLDAIPLVDNKNVDNFLNEEEYFNFINAYYNSVEFLEKYRY
jgi:malate/lactate dehydrogenase